MYTFFIENSYVDQRIIMNLSYSVMDAVMFVFLQIIQ